MFFSSIVSLQASDIDKLTSPKLLSKIPLSYGFDFPVGKPDAKNYYNAQMFGKNYHLGEDWNGKGGGNTDLGDSVFSISNGVVVFAEDLKGGWGNVVRVVHNIGVDKKSLNKKPRYVESVYAHLKVMDVKIGDVVKKGEKLGTIGNVDGLYLAHLHLELRDQLNLPIGPGYSKKTKGYLKPTQFIRKNRVIKH